MRLKEGVSWSGKNEMLVAEDLLIKKKIKKNNHKFDYFLQKLRSTVRVKISGFLGNVSFPILWLTFDLLGPG